MDEHINKIDPFLGLKMQGIHIKQNQPQINQQQQIRKEEPIKQEKPAKSRIDIPGLQEGVSKFNIDGNKVTLYKQGDNIDMQVISAGPVNMTELQEKIKQQISQ